MNLIYKDKIFEAKKIVENAGLQFGIQLHNSIDKNFI
jgi:hypothetical protein